MLWPGPSKISDFQALPNSYKSQLEGDTIQIPNVAGYFSNNYRDFIVSFYLKNYQINSHLFFPPLKINHAPEYSWIAIKRHTDSTYLEELIFPLRDSLYVNGMEPFNPDKSPKYWGSRPFEEGGGVWETKTTLRFYPSPLWSKFIVWALICSSIFLLHRAAKRIIF